MKYLVLVILTISATALSERAATYTVTNTNDSGPGSLRNGVIDPSIGLITFNIDGCPDDLCTIILTSGGFYNLLNRGLTVSNRSGQKVVLINGEFGGINVDLVIEGITVKHGGIQAICCSVRLERSEIINGGNGSYGVYVQGANLYIGNSTIANNGTGLYAFDAVPYIVNSTISGNSAAGIQSYYTIQTSLSQKASNQVKANEVATLINSTVTNNSVGVDMLECSGVTARNSIVSGNGLNLAVSSTGVDPCEFDLGNNILDGTPHLQPLADNGGPTMTHALMLDSPAINAGNNCVLLVNGCGDNNPALQTDQRGFNRIGAVDIGAFENQSRKVPVDFDGDGKSDIGITRPNSGIEEWWISRSSDSNVFATVFGVPSDIPTPGDFTGDGKTDIALFRPSTGQWFVLRSDDFSYAAFPFGTNGDIPMPADYDGDGKTDPAVFRPSQGTWFISRTSDNQTTIAQFGVAGDKPVSADYDGDGKADMAVYRLNNGAEEWWIQRSSAGLFATVFGVSGDKAVPGDYTGDGKVDIAVWRPSNGNWFILRSEDLSFLAFPWGANGDLPAPGDYDGDGKTDAAVFRASQSTWFINRTGGQGPLITSFGASTDLPVAGAYVR